MAVSTIARRPDRRLLVTVAVLLALLLARCTLFPPVSSPIYKQLRVHAGSSGVGMYALTISADGAAAAEAIDRLIEDGFHIVGNLSVTGSVLVCGQHHIQRFDGVAILLKRGNFPFDRFGYVLELAISDDCLVTAALGRVNHARLP